jgi:hypothetical protein
MGTYFHQMELKNNGWATAVILTKRDYCRVCNCTHKPWPVHNIWETTQESNMCVSRIVKCKCSEFVPSDNLDYIEWLAEKKGLV